MRIPDMCALNVLLVTPAAKGTLHGNRVTATRWARILRSLGCRVTIACAFEDQRCDLLVALHARKSAPSVMRFRRDRPGHPLVLCLTGTDLYQDLATSTEAARSIELADRIVTLEPFAARKLEPAIRHKARTIYQSSEPLKTPVRPLESCFEICVSGHLREVKDPFCAARAAALLPSESQIRITHLGGALSAEMEAAAYEEMRINPRYRWLGEKPRSQARRMLCRSRLMVISSVLEGGANVVSEAIVCKVPVLASRIPGNVGLLGEAYPGFFEVGNGEELAELMLRAETDGEFLESLRRGCSLRSKLFEPSAEKQAWRSLLAELLLKSK